MDFEFFKNGCVGSNKSDGRRTLTWLTHELDCTELVTRYRNGDKDAKRHIPAICAQGFCDASGERKADKMVSNGCVMVDLDHMPELPSREFLLGEEFQSKLAYNRVHLAYITCSGTGLRFIFPQFNGIDVAHSALLFVKRLNEDWVQYLDTVTVDVSRLSILTAKDDYFHVFDILDSAQFKLLEPTEEEKKLCDSYPIVADYVKSVRDKVENKGEDKDVKHEGEEGEDKKPANAKEVDYDNLAYKNYPESLIEENDRLFADYKFKGRKVSEIAESFISYKTKGMGPEAGERHALYGLLCRNFKNLVDNDPRALHAVLPSLGHPLKERWSQCHFYTSHSKSERLPKEFYYWLKDHGLLEYAQTDDVTVESEEDTMYNKFLREMPPLPPIIREFVKVAPKWFKLPVVTSLQCYTALLCTNHRSYYFDGMPISTTLYSLVYAPAASGKSYVRKLKTILNSTDQRDKLAIEKAKWYDRQQRENNGSGKLPEEIVWKQRLFASKTSLGEILKRQEAIGEHHWLQDVGEFSIWAATIKKNKEEWSAFFRTSYDNEEFSQSYQSANAYRGKVAVYPIVHGTCTIGQIKSFFTNVEDGLLSRFSFVPLLHQRFASYQSWKVMSDKDQAVIDRVLKRLDYETYEDIDEEPEEIDEDYNADGTPSKEKGDSKDWDYDFKDPIWHDLGYVHEALLKWLEDKRLEAKKDDNDALDTFRRRCARNAFAYAIICRALFGRNDKKTREKIVANALWDAEVKLYYMRYMWENRLNDELATQKTEKKGIRQKPVYDVMPQTFTIQVLETQLMSDGYKTKPRVILSNWLQEGLIKKISKTKFEKLIK